MRTVVLVHGAWHGPWCWAPVLAGLDELGVSAVPVDLPGPDLAADARAVEEAVEAAAAATGQRVVLVGHSYGGMVITEAGTHPSVERLVYLAALAPDAGESAIDIGQSDAAPSDLAGAIEVLDDGTMVIDPAKVPDVFYADCEAVDVERSVALLRPQPLATFTARTRAVAWRQRPTTYVVCGADRAVHPDQQRWLAARIPEVALVELAGSSHSPFLSRPGDVVDVIAGVAAEGDEEVVP